MANTFQFIGRISRKKENAFVEKTFGSGWLINELNLTMICNDNVQYLRASGGCWDDAHANKNEVMTFKYNPNGKDEPITVKWADRNSPDIVETIANYRTYTVDTEIAADRKAAEDSKDEAAIEASKKKHKTFITAIDFVRWLDKVTSNEKTRDWIWRVTGEVEYSHSNGKWYRNFVPRRVYHVDPVTEQQCIGTIKTFYSDGCVDETEDAYFFNVYTQYYDQMCKKNCFTPMKLEIPKSHPKANGFKMLYSKAEDEQVRELGVNVIYINGAQKVAITEEMLSDEQRELLAMEMITMDDIRKDFGDSIYGDRKSATIIEAIARGYTGGSKETVFEATDLVKLPIKDEVTENSAENDNAAFNLFSDDDDDDDEI